MTSKLYFKIVTTNFLWAWHHVNGLDLSRLRFRFWRWVSIATTR